MLKGSVNQIQIISTNILLEILLTPRSIFVSPQRLALYSNMEIYMSMFQTLKYALPVHLQALSKETLPFVHVQHLVSRHVEF